MTRLARDALRYLPWTVLGLVCVWFAFAAVWGMGSIPLAGHNDAGAAGTTLMTEAMLRWRIAYPSWAWFADQPPPPSSYYCHHPPGMYWLSAAFIALFGMRDFVVHLPAVLMSTATPVLLFAIARLHWGLWAGVVAAAAFALLPITVGFANFHNLEVMAMFGGLLFFWGHGHYQRSDRWRYLIASCLGLVMLTAADWSGYLIAAVLLAWSFVRAFVLSRRATPPLDAATYARWWAWSVVVATSTLLLWVAMTYHAGRFDDLVGSARQRSGDPRSLAEILEGHWGWPNFSLTPVAIFAGQLAFPFVVFRCITKRRDEELFSVAFLCAAWLWQRLFPSGADTHIFWPHLFAVYYALALAQMSATLGEGAGELLRRVSPRRMAIGSTLVVCGFGLAPSLLIAPDAVRSLRIWRETGGRYNERGDYIRSDADLVHVLRHDLRRRLPGQATLQVHPGVRWGWHDDWALRHRVDLQPQPLRRSPEVSLWLARASELSSGEQRQMADHYQVRAVGDFWIVDAAQPPGLLVAQRIDERLPSPWQWLWLGGVEPVRAIRSAADPWSTWEWRHHLGQAAVAAPVPSPRSLEEQRVAHNIAVSIGDEALRRRCWERIQLALQSPAVDFEHGVSLRGVRHLQGPQPRLELWIEAGAEVRGDWRFAVRSVVVAPARFSVVHADATERDMAPSPNIPTGLWKQGFLYRIEVPLLHRIGRERYWGYWASRDGTQAPRRLDGSATTELLMLE